MRKNLWQIVLLLLTFTVSGNDNSSAVWNSGNNFPGWKHFSNATGIVANGVITMTDIRFDCRMSNYKINFDPKNYDTFTYTYRAFDGAGKRGGECSPRAGRGSEITSTSLIKSKKRKNTFFLKKALELCV